MRKRSHESFDEEEPRKKIFKEETYVAPTKVSPGEILTDLSGKQWKVGKVIGHGGFGDIYLASDNLQGPVKNDARYVVKIESHSNGPLFVEINCFIRIAKSQMIQKWTKQNGLSNIGMPNYIASGSHKIGDEKLRFLVLPRYEQDLEKILLNRTTNKFNLKTVVNLGIQILDVLEYIHSKGFIHCDIKASNILCSSADKNDTLTETATKKTTRQCNKMKTRSYTRSNTKRTKKLINYNEDDDLFETYFENEFENCIRDSETSVEPSDDSCKVYLMDYGLATKYVGSNGEHRQYCNDERKAHAGTLMFCSLDAHVGAQSRRSDLECLGYNLIYWLTAKLPWDELMENPGAVERKKKENFQELDKFLKHCFGNEYPIFIYEYFYHIRKLAFEEKPNYELFRGLLRKALTEYGYKSDNVLDFDNLEGWGKKQNYKKKYEIISHKNSPYIQRQPLLSNSPIKKPVLRGKRNKKFKKMNWSKILSSDPEKLFKNKLLKSEEIKPRDRRITDPCETPLQNLDIFKMNPTYAMMDVYNKCRDRNGNINNNNHQHLSLKLGRGDSYTPENNEGYTPAMNLVLARIRERKLHEQFFSPSNNNNGTVKKTRSIRSQTNKRTDLRKSQSAQNNNEVPTPAMSMIFARIRERKFCSQHIIPVIVRKTKAIRSQRNCNVKRTDPLRKILSQGVIKDKEIKKIRQVRVLKRHGLRG